MEDYLNLLSIVVLDRLMRKKILWGFSQKLLTGGREICRKRCPEVSSPPLNKFSPLRICFPLWQLFDFDIEVKPMLEVLVGKTIEQALLEVMEEEELANLRAHQYAFLEMRAAELAEVQRLEEQERRHREEKVQEGGGERKQSLLTGSPRLTAAY